MILKYIRLYIVLLAFPVTALANNVTLLKTYQTDPAVFTQGLERTQTGQILYSSGLYGHSEIGYLTLGSTQRQIIETLPADYFAEGLTVTPYGVWQLSWQEQTAFLRDSQTLQIKQTARYLGEGWGLAYDKQQNQLWLSNGTDRLQAFHPETFDYMGEIQVRYLNEPIFLLNELEFANGFLYANIWQSNNIVKINPKNGEVVQVYDFSEWVKPLNLTDPNDVLNGIAHLDGNRFLITGKRYPVIWEVELGGQPSFQ